MRDDRDLEAVRGLSLTVRGGEIVALAGVDGNGQHELVEAIAGLRNAESGRIAVAGKDVSGRGVRATCDAGVAHIAEDRQLRGLVLDFTLAENLALRDYHSPPLSRTGWLNIGHINSRARSLLAEYDVRGGSRETTLAGSLSGGNQQKVCIAREIASDPQLLIAHQPTRGLDVGAIEFVHRRLVAEREKGRGVLLVSLESEEVRSLADRILVIYEGRIVGEFPPDATEEELGFAMTGGKGRTARDGAGRPARGAPAAQTPASRLAAYMRGGGVIVPLLTALLAFLIGGLVVLVTGHDPIATYKAIFEGTGLQWLFPWVTGADRATAALQPAADADPDDAADPRRAGRGVRVPRRPVQHRRPGPVHRRLDRGRVGGVVVRGDAGLPAHRARDGRRLPGGRRVGRDRRACSRRPSAPTR